MNSWCIVTQYFHQYAEGITGASRSTRVYFMEDGMGFPYAAAAYKACKDAGIKPYERGQRNYSGPKVGFTALNRVAVQVKDLESFDMAIYADVEYFKELGV